jgi:FimV-like protein
MANTVKAIAKVVPGAVLLFFVSLLLSCSGDPKTEQFQQALAHYQQGDYVRARVEFGKVLQLDPKDVETLFFAGQLEEREQNWHAAYALLLRAADLAPADTGIQLHLGRLSARMKMWEQARAMAGSVLKGHPDDPVATFLKELVQAGQAGQMLPESMAQLAEKVDPEDPGAIFLLAGMYADLGELDQAVALTKRGVQENTNDIGMRLLLARLYGDSGDTEGAAAVLAELVRLHPDSISARVRLAAYHYNRGDPEATEKLLRAAVEEIPESLAAKSAFVEFLVKERREEDAESELLGFIAKEPDALELQLELARFYVAVGKRDQARKLFQQVSEKDPGGEYGAKADARLASVLLLEQEQEEALALLDTVLKQNPADREALLIRAAVLLADKKIDPAIRDLDALLKIAPGDARAHRLEARAHLLKQEATEARKSLENAILARPQEAVAELSFAEGLSQIGGDEQALPVLEMILRFAPDHIGALQGIAKIYIGKQQWEDARPLVQRLLENDPANAVGYYYEGVLLQGEERFEESVRAFEQALERSPDGVEPLIALSRSLLVLDRSQEALERVQQVVNRNPEHFLAWNLLGEIQLQRKEYAAAEKALQQALAIAPKWSIPYRNLIRIRLEQQRPEAAVAMVREGYEKTGDIVLGLELAAYYEQRGEYDLAVKLYEELLSRKPDLQVAANNLAMLLVRGEAEPDALDRALALSQRFENSDNPILLDTLGWVYFKRGDLAHAVPVLQRAQLAAPELPEISYHLGMAYYRNGRNEEARVQLAKSLEQERPFRGREEAKRVLDSLGPEEDATKD